MPFTEEEVISYFENKAAETWEIIEQNFLLRNPKQCLQEIMILEDLIDYRDIIDYKLYKEAIEKIFPNYHLSKRVYGDIRENRFGRHYYKIQLYDFVVSPCDIDNKNASCLIRIRARAGRIRTSAIKASIMTWVQGDTTVLLAEAHTSVREGGIDYQGKITRAIKDYFNQCNEREFNKGSSLHPNSNAYIALMAEAKKVKEYPKIAEERDSSLNNEQQCCNTFSRLEKSLKQKDIIPIKKLEELSLSSTHVTPLLPVLPTSPNRTEYMQETKVALDSEDNALIERLSQLAIDQKKSLQEVKLNITKDFENGKFYKALSQYEGISEEQLTLPMQCQKAEIFIWLGEFEKAEEYINKVLGGSPTHLPLWEYKRLLCLTQEQAQQVNEPFIQSSTATSTSLRILIYQVYKHLYESNIQKSRDCFSEAISLGYKEDSLEHALITQADSFLEKEKKNDKSAPKLHEKAANIASSIPFNHQLQFCFLIAPLLVQTNYKSEPLEKKLKQTFKEKIEDAFYHCIQFFINFQSALKNLLKDEWYENFNRIFISTNQLKAKEYLGRGTYGEVHRGKWLGQIVAIKKMSPTKVAKDAFLHFVQEAHVFNNIRHPNIVHYLGVSITKEFYLLIMEYLGKISLKDYIEDELAEPLKSWFAKVRILEGIAEGLAFLHSKGISHRDLKPENILIDGNGCPKLIDLGSSQINCKMESNFSISTSKLVSNQHVGTINYMAPEVLRAKNEAERKRIAFDKADVFSFGMVMWQIARKKTPWENFSPYIIIEKVGYKKEREHIDAKWLPVYRTLLQTCWEEDPKDRYTAQTVLTKLNEAKQAMSPDVIVPELKF